MHHSLSSWFYLCWAERLWHSFVSLAGSRWDLRAVYFLAGVYSYCALYISPLWHAFSKKRETQQKEYKKDRNEWEKKVGDKYGWLKVMCRLVLQQKHEGTQREKDDEKLITFIYFLHKTEALFSERLMLAFAMFYFYFTLYLNFYNKYIERKKLGGMAIPILRLENASCKRS